MVVVRKDLPPQNMQELIAYAKANPGKLSFGHPGVGSSVHLHCELLAPPSSIVPVSTDNARALEVMGPERSPSMPDVPTTGEQGRKGLETLAWTALFAPKGTPRPVVETLEKPLIAALDDPERAHRQVGRPCQVRQSREAMIRQATTEGAMT